MKPIQKLTLAALSVPIIFSYGCMNKTLTSQVARNNAHVVQQLEDKLTPKKPSFTQKILNGNKEIPSPTKEELTYKLVEDISNSGVVDYFKLPSGYFSVEADGNYKQRTIQNLVKKYRADMPGIIALYASKLADEKVISNYKEAWLKELTTDAFWVSIFSLKANPSSTTRNNDSTSIGKGGDTTMGGSATWLPYLP